jgi:type II secretory pathway pseudopilin PulG
MITTIQHHSNFRAKCRRGMTLLELTIIIIVVLTLISLLFIGASAWKRGSDRSANLMNLRNTQQVMRAHQNLHNLPEGAPFTIAQLETYINMPDPPNSAIGYLPFEEIMPIGYLWINPQHGGAIGYEFGPKVGETDDW